MIKDELFSLRDENYKKFNSALIPNIDPDTIIGVRVPALRKLSKTLYSSGDYQDFLSDLPHEFFEENCLHAYIVEQIKDYDVCMAECEKFLPFIDNWAVCDTFAPKVFARHKSDLLAKINLWLLSTHPYTVRFGVCMLMRHSLDLDFKVDFLHQVAKIKSEDYYVKMVIAWFFATALTKRYDDTIPFIENRVLSTWIHNKAIQKAIESLRIEKDKKEYLKSLKVK